MLHQPKSNDSLLASNREEEPVFAVSFFGANRIIDWLRNRLLAKLRSSLACAFVTLAVWAQTVTVFAQGKGKNQPAAATGEKSYVLSYVIVVLCIALGLLVVCRSGGRSNEPKLDNLE
jgi:hypothetical protein